MNCLHDMNYKDIVDLAENELGIDLWRVRNARIQERTESISYTAKFETLKNLALSKGYTFSDIEVVTWIDSLSILYRVFEKIEDTKLRASIRLLQEYRIPFSNKRADFILVYHNKILILEFSFKKLGYELQYETKLSQAIGYKELLSSILPKEIEIGTFTFLVEAEEEGFEQPIYVDGNNRLPNDDQIENLAKYIERFFKKNERVALDALNRISSEDSLNVELRSQSDINYERYKEISNKYPQYIIALQCDDWYEIYGDDAETISKKFGIGLFRRYLSDGSKLLYNRFSLGYVEFFASKILGDRGFAYGSSIYDLKIFKKENND